MIRAGMDLPPALRLRLRADAAAEGIASRIRTVRRRFVSVVRNDIAALRSLRLAVVHDTRDSHSSTATLDRAEIMMYMSEFVSRYDDLVDLLCWSAKEGVSDGRRARYGELRTWFVQNYEPVRPIVTRYLDVLPEDREPVVEGTPAPRDAFESLFLPNQIDVLIHSDVVIHRIMRTRFAVEACREELERECVIAG